MAVGADLKRNEPSGRAHHLLRARTHFLGKLPYDKYRKALQVSAAHVYLSYPFVLSWSMLEAMASGCAVVGSRTAPVQEVIRDGENGRLVNFFDTAQIAKQVTECLDHPEAAAAQRVVARKEFQERYSRAAGLRQYRTMVSGLVDANGAQPDASANHLLHALAMNE